MEQSPATIAETVESCVAYAAGSDRPFQQVAEFLSLLKSASWTQGDIDRVQTLAVAELVKRREDRPGAPSAAETP